jgi:hypothetical protein
MRRCTFAVAMVAVWALVALVVPSVGIGAQPSAEPHAVVDSTTVAPGGTLTVTSVAPCDLNSPEASAVRQGLVPRPASEPTLEPGVLLSLASATRMVTPQPGWATDRPYLMKAQGSGHQAADGSWVGTVQVSSDFPLGPATLIASCNLGDYIGTTYWVYESIDILIAEPAPATPTPTVSAQPTTTPAAPGTAPAAPADATSPQSDGPWWLLLLLLVLAFAVAATWYWTHRRGRQHRPE